jgi:hypothetical protein
MKFKALHYYSTLCYGLHNWGSIPGKGKRPLSLSPPQRPDRLWGPPNLVSNGYWGLSSGVKWLQLEADQSLPSNAEVKKGKAIPSLPNTSW